MSHTMTIWRTQVRFIGAGTIGVSAIRTLAKLSGPVVGGLVATLRASSASASTDPSTAICRRVGSCG